MCGFNSLMWTAGWDFKGREVWGCGFGTAEIVRVGIGLCFWCGDDELRG